MRKGGGEGPSEPPAGGVALLVSDWANRPGAGEHVETCLLMPQGHSGAVLRTQGVRERQKGTKGHGFFGGLDGRVGGMFSGGSLATLHLPVCCPLRDIVCGSVLKRYPSVYYSETQSFSLRYFCIGVLFKMSSSCSDIFKEAENFTSFQTVLNT